MIITRTPLRLSLGGGGTDLYNWYKKNSSFLITATINKFIYVTISERKILKDFWLSYSTIENEKNKKNIRQSIIRKVLEKYNIKKGLEVHTVSEVPSNSGLGSSGSLTVGFIKALSGTYLGNRMHRCTQGVDVDLVDAEVDAAGCIMLAASESVEATTTHAPVPIRPFRKKSSVTCVNSHPDVSGT
jgi:D-glycero-alpha-D-manno-heptose-7-phosphate kinase